MPSLKAKNLEFLENLKEWFKFKYEIIFFNVYGKNHIKKGMATVMEYIRKSVLK